LAFPEPAVTFGLAIDLDKCRECRSCKAPCSYRMHPGNDGIARLREIAEFSDLCRRCVNPPCVKACPSGALERASTGIPERNGLLCVACRSCSHACPFGVILPELMRIDRSVCDFCLGRLKPGESPVCVEGCGRGAIRYGDFKPEEGARGRAVGEHLIVYAIPWRTGAES